MVGIRPAEKLNPFDNREPVIQCEQAEAGFVLESCGF